MCYHAQSGYMWFFSANVALDGWVWRRRPTTGSPIEALQSVNPGKSQAASNGLQSEPISTQPFILAHRREEIVPSLLDVTNPNSPTWYTITPSGMSWPTHWWTRTHEKAFIGRWCWNPVDQWFNGFFMAPDLSNVWQYRDRIYTLKVPGVTPGVSGNPRSTAWPLSYVTVAGNLPGDDGASGYWLQGPSCHKNLNFISVPAKGMKGLLFLNGPFAKPLFYRM